MCEPLQGKIQFANWVNPCFRVKDILKKKNRSKEEDVLLLYYSPER
jgi:hypothetical protein